MKKLLLTTIALLATGWALAENVNVTSPDGRLSVTFACENGRAFYSVDYDGQQVLHPSALGLKTSIGDLTRGLTLKDTKNGKVSNQYQMRGTKASSADCQAYSLTLDLQNQDGVEMGITFQVSNHDVAFRYEMPRQKINRKEMKRVRNVRPRRPEHTAVHSPPFPRALDDIGRVSRDSHAVQGQKENGDDHQKEGHREGNAPFGLKVPPQGAGRQEDQVTDIGQKKPEDMVPAVKECLPEQKTEHMPSLLLS